METDIEFLETLLYYDSIPIEERFKIIKIIKKLDGEWSPVNLDEDLFQELGEYGDWEL